MKTQQKHMSTYDPTSKPLAAPGLISYRCKGPFGWVMIGATDLADAVREAGRSTVDVRLENMEVWDGSKYVSVLEQMGKPKYKVGDVVNWVNDYGAVWAARRIVALEDPDQWGHRYYLEPTDAPWMYTREKNLKLETMSFAEIEAALTVDGSLRRRCEQDPMYLFEVSKAIEDRQQQVVSPAQSLGLSD
ncbi:hypothetical protein [Paraburkholderia sp. SIMBA_054]|uniref:hypothetical protein n=1 Tax=Paraburkholderia sp. SIMBA_054 TaxID=3085795 RepID=UPI0039797596